MSRRKYITAVRALKFELKRTVALLLLLYLKVYFKVYSPGEHLVRPDTYKICSVPVSILSTDPFHRTLEN